MKATTEKAFGAKLQSVFSNPCEKWQMKKLGEIFSIERGGSPRPIERYLTDSQDGINWIKISDTRDITKYIYTTKEKIIPDGVKRSRMVYEGDFILSNSMSFGRPYIMKTQGCIHDGWLVLRNNQSLIDNDFLYYVLSSDFVYQQFNMLAYGSTVRNLNIGLVQKVKIPVPPLPEQHRIVSILDKAFTEIDKAKKNTEENIKKNKELFEAKLQSVFSNPSGNWQLKKLGEVCETSSGGTPLKAHKDYYENGLIPWLLSGEVRAKSF
jgi:type I restriction enzyme, S subunit